MMLFTDEEIEEFDTWYSKFKRENTRSSSYELKKSYERKYNCPIKDKIKIVYTRGYGLKLIARSLSISYSKLRYLFGLFEFDIRRGLSVVTDVTREIRSENAKNWEDNPFRSWPSKRPKLSKGRGISGYYKRDNGSYVWLRSTYEYIFAKWLDNMGLIWDVEVCRYILSTNETYVPDFFIYNSNEELDLIVEIKSDFYTAREEKPKLLDKELATPVVIIKNIEFFTQTTYVKERELWKKTRIEKRLSL